MSVGSGIGTVLSAIVLHDDASGHTFLPNVTVVHEGEEVPEMLQQSAVLCVDFSTEGDVKSIAPFRPGTMVRGYRWEEHADQGAPVLHIEGAFNPCDPSESGTSSSGSRVCAPQQQQSTDELYKEFAMRNEYLRSIIFGAVSDGLFTFKPPGRSPRDGAGGGSRTGAADAAKKSVFVRNGAGGDEASRAARTSQLEVAADVNSDSPPPQAKLLVPSIVISEGVHMQEPRPAGAGAGAAVSGSGSGNGAVSRVPGSRQGPLRAIHLAHAPETAGLSGDGGDGGGVVAANIATPGAGDQSLNPRLSPFRGGPGAVGPAGLRVRSPSPALHGIMPPSPDVVTTQMARFQSQVEQVVQGAVDAIRGQLAEIAAAHLETLGPTGTVASAGGATPSGFRVLSPRAAAGSSLAVAGPASSVSGSAGAASNVVQPRAVRPETHKQLRAMQEHN